MCLHYSDTVSPSLFGPLKILLMIDSLENGEKFNTS